MRYKLKIWLINPPRIAIAAYLAFAVATLLLADPAREIRDRFETAVERWINGDTTAQSLLGQLDALERLATSVSADWQRLYWEARIALLRGEVLYQAGRREESLGALGEATGKSRESIAARETADAWRVMAEAGSLSMMQRGFAYIVVNHAKPRNHAARALELDRDNARAAVVVAVSLCNTPRVVGGDFDAGIAILEETIARDDLSRVDRYRTLIGLANVLLSDDQNQRALELCRGAQTLFPASPEARDLFEQASREPRPQT